MMAVRYILKINKNLSMKYVVRIIFLLIQMWDDVNGNYSQWDI